MTRSFATGIIMVVVAFVGSAQGQTQDIPLRSGSGIIGGADPGVRALIGPSWTEITAVRTASFAVVRETVDHAMPGLQVDPVARWIRPDVGEDVVGRLALYAVPFTVNEGSFTYADLQYVARVQGFADDRLGAELLLNGQPIGGIQSATDGDPDQWFVVEEIAEWLTPGVNWLHVRVPGADLETGLIFSARVRIWRPDAATESVGDTYTGEEDAETDRFAAQVGGEGCVGYSCRSRGDLDSDHDVDLDDYYRFSWCISGPNTEHTVDCEYADFECDGDVDLADVARFQNEFDGPW